MRCALPRRLPPASLARGAHGRAYGHRTTCRGGSDPLCPRQYAAGDRNRRIGLCVGGLRIRVRQSLAAVTDDDIDDAAASCISHHWSLVRVKPGFARKEHAPGSANRRGKGPGDMIRSGGPIRHLGGPSARDTPVSGIPPRAAAQRPWPRTVQIYEAVRLAVGRPRPKG